MASTLSVHVASAMGQSAATSELMYQMLTTVTQTANLRILKLRKRMLK
jgi:hypothetical protein